MCTRGTLTAEWFLHGIPLSAIHRTSKWGTHVAGAKTQIMSYSLGVRRLRNCFPGSPELLLQATHWLLNTQASGDLLLHPNVDAPAELPGLRASHFSVQFSHAQPVQDGPRARARWGRGSHLGPLAGKMMFGPMSMKFPAGSVHHTSSTRPFHDELYAWAYYGHGKDLFSHSASFSHNSA